MYPNVFLLMYPNQEPMKNTMMDLKVHRLKMFYSDVIFAVNDFLTNRSQVKKYVALKETYAEK